LSVQAGLVPQLQIETIKKNSAMLII